MRSYYLVFFFFFLSNNLLAQAPTNVPKKVLREIAYSTPWLRLNHYESKFLTGYRSRISASDYFLAPDGGSDPLAELTRSVALFQSDSVLRDKQTAQCAYPARYSLVKRALAKRGVALQDQPCPRFEQWRKSLSVSSLSLIFPTSFMNNPASMFGHTLLRLDRKGLGVETHMLAYSVNFAAATAGENALLYAAKGVLGGYNGYFSVGPYYERLNTYSDIESRDIWEYELNVSQSEVQFLLAALWELRGVPFSYFYFDENCSYQLLALLEVMRPSLDLRSHFKVHVIPVDTVRIILAQEGLLKSVRFRPSNVNRIKSRLQQTPESLQKVAERFIADEAVDLAMLSERERAMVLELAYDLIDYHRRRNQADTSTEEQRLLTILTARSQLPQSGVVIDELYKPKKRSPHEGHKTSRSSLGYRYENESHFTDLSIRPAYHDILDFDAGYEPGAGIDFLVPTIRLRESQGVQLAAFDILKIDSLTPLTRFFRPYSWQFDIGFSRRYFETKRDSLQFDSSLNVGRSVAFGSTLFSVLPGLRFRCSQRYQDNCDVNPSFSLNVLTDLSDNVRIQPKVKLFTSMLYSSQLLARVEIPVRVAISTNTALKLYGAKEWTETFNYNSVGASFDYHW